MSGAGAPAVAAFIALVVLLAGVLGIAEVPGEAFGGLVLVVLGLAALAWGREDDA